MNKRKLTLLGILAVFFASLILSPSSSHSAIYKWVDKKGHVHITDYHPGSDEMADEPTTVPTEKPAAETQVAKETPQQPVEEKREAPVALQLPQQKPQPAPEARQSSPPDTPKPQMSLFPKDLPKFPPGKFPGDASGMITGIIAMLGTFFLVIGLVFYLFFSACLYRIAKKLEVPVPWLAWIPLVQVWTFVVAAKGTDGQPVLWLIGLIVPIVGAFIGIYLWMCITENMRKNKWLGLLTLLPIVNLIFMAWLASLKVPSSAPAEAV